MDAPAAPRAPLAVERAAPRLIFGSVMHRRLRPTQNRFVYPVYYLTLPLGKLDAARRRWFSVDAWNLIGFRRADHGARDGSDLLVWIRALLAREGLAAADGDVVLQCFPRVLGYVFNPVSFWYCHDREGRVRAILAEVSNTFGEHHSYLLSHPDGSPMLDGEEFRATKVFHVSPFCKVEGGYRFRFHARGGRLLARIDYADAEGDLLHTSVSGESRELDGAGFARAFFGHPWMTVGVMLRIHWQALRLWIRRVPFFTKPVPPVEEVTR